MQDQRAWVYATVTVQTENTTAFTLTFTFTVLDATGAPRGTPVVVHQQVPAGKTSQLVTAVGNMSEKPCGDVRVTMSANIPGPGIPSQTYPAPVVKNNCVD